MHFFCPSAIGTTQNVTIFGERWENTTKYVGKPTKKDGNHNKLAKLNAQSWI